MRCVHACLYVLHAAGLCSCFSVLQRALKVAASAAGQHICMCPHSCCWCGASVYALQPSTWKYEQACLSIALG